MASAFPARVLRLSWFRMRVGYFLTRMCLNLFFEEDCDEISGIAATLGCRVRLGQMGERYTPRNILLGGGGSALLFAQYHRRRKLGAVRPSAGPKSVPSGSPGSSNWDVTIVSCLQSLFVAAKEAEVVMSRKARTTRSQYMIQGYNRVPIHDKFPLLLQG